MEHKRSNSPDTTEDLIDRVQQVLWHVGEALRDGIKSNRIVDSTPVRNIYRWLRNIEIALCEVSPDPTAVKELSDTAVDCYSAIMRHTNGKCLLSSLEWNMSQLDSDARSIRASLPSGHDQDLKAMVDKLPAWLREHVFFK